METVCEAVEQVPRTLVIAEPGCTHEGSFDKLVQLLHVAADAGCDVYKPQWVSDPVAMCERRQMVNDPTRPANNPKFANAAEEYAYYLRAYSWLNFPIEWHGELKRTCVERGMQYACTVFLPQDVGTLRWLTDLTKVASFEAEDCELLREVINNRPAREIVVSMGMGAQWSFPYWHPKLLHCVSAYPAPVSAMNLAVIQGRRLKQFSAVGLSDHSRHLLTGAVAVACGAEVIETHFRLDDCDPDNPDYAVAFTPAEFRQYIQHIRDAELMLGDGEKKIQPCEAWALPYRVVS